MDFNWKLSALVVLCSALAAVGSYWLSKYFAKKEKARELYPHGKPVGRITRVHADDSGVHIEAIIYSHSRERGMDDSVLLDGINVSRMMEYCQKDVEMTVAMYKAFPDYSPTRK